MIWYNSWSECSVYYWNTSHLILFQQQQLFSKVTAARKAVTYTLKPACTKWLGIVEPSLLPVKSLDMVSAIQRCIECLAAQEKLDELGESVRLHYADIFSSIPYMGELPNNFMPELNWKTCWYA